MNAKVHDTIGVSPAELLYGKAINLYTGCAVSKIKRTWKDWILILAIRGYEG
jgi:hypothetical protein